MCSRCSTVAMDTVDAECYHVGRSLNGDDITQGDRRKTTAHSVPVFLPTTIITNGVWTLKFVSLDRNTWKGNRTPLNRHNETNIMFNTWLVFSELDSRKRFTCAYQELSSMKYLRLKSEPSYQVTPVSSCCHFHCCFSHRLHFFHK